MKIGASHARLLATFRRGTIWRGTFLQSASVSGCRRHNHSSGEEVEEKLDLFESVLRATASRRDARTYLQNFKPSPLSSDRLLPGHVLREKNRIFIKGILKKSQRVGFGGVTDQDGGPLVSPTEQEALHVGLVKIRLTPDTDDSLLRRVGKTLRRLLNLGLKTIVVLDTSGIEPVTQSIAQVRDQVDRIVENLERARVAARRVEWSFSIDGSGNLQCSSPNTIVAPLSRGVLPVLAPLALDSVQCVTQVSAGSILLALTQELSRQQPDGMKLGNVDRIFILDPLGGVPSAERQSGGAHVFLNLQQEYEKVLQSLQADKTMANKIHLSNLNTARDCLSQLPRTSSALVTTLASAAAIATSPVSSARASRNDAHRNPLIHNLLTDKPVFSSSLPDIPSRPTTNTTFVKYGMPVLTIPPSSFSGGFRFSNHPAIQLPRLVALVEDSFGKKLDVDHYLKRVDGKTACVIIAGDYEGGAIITWEEGEGGRVPYLDKFIVARRSQGVGGVADVVFKAMVDVFPNELLWRSRSSNPVNKWYFDRSRGTFKVNKKWSMFWTTEGVSSSRLQDYIKICSSIEPSLVE